MNLFRKIRKPRFILGYSIAIASFFLAHTTKQSLIIGAVIVLLGESIRLWANGYVGHRKVNQTQGSGPTIGQLITAGPYAFVRHPLYFGTLIIGAGFCVIVGSPWLALVTFIFFIAVYHHKMAEEEETIRHEWGETFDRYQRAVPQWFPTGRRYAQRHGEWSWAGIRASQEFKTLTWVIVVVILLFFRLELLQEREPLLAGQPLLRLALLGLVTVLVLIDGIPKLRKWSGAARSKATGAAG